MRDLNYLLTNLTIEYDKLIKYGFLKHQQGYRYETSILDDSFKIIIEFLPSTKRACLIDAMTDEEYSLVDVNRATGEFVGKIKEKYEMVIGDVIEKCTSLNIFKSQQVQELTDYIKEKYDDQLQYLWKKFPKNAVWKNKINQKWYGILLVITKDKLGIDSNDEIEIIDLRYPKEHIHEIIDNIHIFPGYHMNKNNWITIVLDSGFESSAIYKLVDNSYQLSLHK